MNDDLRTALQQIHALAKQGDKAQAKQQLAEFLKAHPNNADAWYLVNLLSDEPERKIKALQRALQINPNYTPAQRALEKLQPSSSADPLDSVFGADATPAKQAELSAPESRRNLGILAAVSVVMIVIVAAACILSGTASRLMVALQPPTPTFTPTNTPTSTPTSTPTNTPTPTATATNTPTSTPTSTPLPTEDVVIPTLLPTRTLPPTRTPPPTWTLPPTWTPTFTPTPRFQTLNAPILPLAFEVADAEYSAALGRIVLASSAPPALHLYDPATDQITSVELSRAPTSLSLAPDGRFAAVGHDALISYIDLTAAQVVKTFEVPVFVFDLALAGNGFVYFGDQGQWVDLRAVNVSTGEVLTDGSGRLWGGVRLALHPNGRRLYSANRDSQINTTDISAGRLEPFGGSFEAAACGGMWFSRDGRRLFTGCGVVLRASEDRDQDLTYNGRFTENARVRSLADTASQSRFLALVADPLAPYTGYGETYPLLGLYNSETLTAERAVWLPDMIADGQTYPPDGRFVFVDADDTRYYVILKAGGESKAYGLLKGSLSGGLEGAANPGDGAPTERAAVTALPTEQAAPTDAAAAARPVKPFAFSVVDADLSRSLKRLVIAAADPSQLHVFDPATGTDIAIDLPRVPTSVAVSPDGRFAAVGHDALVTYIDLEQAAVVKTIEVPASLHDLVLPGNGFIYAAQAGQWTGPITISIESKDVNIPPHGHLWGTPVLRLHPDGKRIYGSNPGLSPSKMHRTDIGNGEAKFIGEWPYHGDRESFGDLWIAEDGKRIYTASGVTVRVSEDPKQDMVYAGSLDRVMYYVAQWAAADKILALPGKDGGFAAGRGQPTDQLLIYNNENLTLENELTLPEFAPGVASLGLYILVDGADFYVIVRAADGTILNNYGYFKGTLSDGTD